MYKFKKLLRSHSLVYDREKMFFYDKITLIFSILLAAALYTLFVDVNFPFLKAVGYTSIFALFAIIIIDYILFPFIIKKIFGYGINGVWTGEFIIEEPEYRILAIKEFEILDFGKKCLVTVVTDSFISNSVVAKVSKLDDNRIVLRFIYYVSYINIAKDDHYGMTELIFYNDDNLPPRGEYYTQDNGVLRNGRINLLEKIK